MALYTIGQALGTSLLGFSVVFCVLAVLILMIKIIGALAGQRQPAAAAAVIGGADHPSAIAAAAPAPVMPTGIPAGKRKADGSLGEISLHTVDDRTAAMIMAVVADRLDTPLNELRFISIKEVE